MKQVPTHSGKAPSIHWLACQILVFPASIVSHIQIAFHWPTVISLQGHPIIQQNRSGKSKHMHRLMI